MWKLLKIFLFIMLCFNNCLIAENLPEAEVFKIDNKIHDDCIQNLDFKDETFIKLYWGCKIDIMNNLIKEYKKDGNFSHNYIQQLEKIKLIYKFRLDEGQDKLNQKLNQKRSKQKIFLEEEDGYYFNLIKEKYNTDLLLLNIVKTRKLQDKINKRDQQIIDFQINNRCVPYKHNKQKYNLCIFNERNKQLCIMSLDEAVKEKTMENRYKCKLEAINEYPDTLVLYNDEYEKLMNKTKYKQVRFNRHELKETEKKLKALNKKMSGPKISKEQLLIIRQEAEEYCNFNKNKELELFKSILIQNCENMENL